MVGLAPLDPPYGGFPQGKFLGDRNHAITNPRLARDLRAQEPTSHQLRRHPAGNHGDRLDPEHHPLLQRSRGAGNGLPGGQCPGAPQVRHLAGLLRRRHAGRDHSRGIRRPTEDVGHRGTGQHLAQAVDAYPTPGEKFSPHRHLAAQRVSGEKVLGRGGNILASHWLRQRRRHDGIQRQENAFPQESHQDAGERRSPRGGRCRRRARAQGSRFRRGPRQEVPHHRRAAADGHGR